MSNMLIPIDTLGAEIKARVEAGDKALDKAEQHYIAAGIQLAEAQKRLKETREMRWSAFLFSHARMSRSRAYELIALGDGRTSLADMRAKGAERVARHAEKNRQARSDLSVTNGQISLEEVAGVQHTNLKTDNDGIAGMPAVQAFWNLWALCTPDARKEFLDLYGQPLSKDQVTQIRNIAA